MHADRTLLRFQRGRGLLGKHREVVDEVAVRLREVVVRDPQQRILPNRIEEGVTDARFGLAREDQRAVAQLAQHAPRLWLPARRLRRRKRPAGPKAAQTGEEALLGGAKTLEALVQRGPQGGMPRIEIPCPGR